MTVTPDQNQAQEVKPNDKELNFRRQEETFKRQLDQERQARIAAEQRASELTAAKATSRSEDEDDDRSDEPYIDEKRLQKKLAKFEKSMDAKIDQKAEQKARMLVEEERRANYLKSNNDFNEIMNADNVEKFAEKYPSLAENILRMPEGFERQKLVYENIKALGVNKKEVPIPSVQDKIDANRRSPYYQPSGIGAAPYGQPGTGGKDYSSSEKKSAYDQMQQLKARLRI